MRDENDISIERDGDLDDSVLAEEAQGATIKKLKEKVKSAEDKAKEYLDGWQRSQADFANLRKRDEEAKSEFMKFANTNLLMSLMPVLDALDVALNAPHPGSASHPSPSFRRGEGGEVGGLESIQKLLLQVLKQNGLEEFNPLGAPFDPREHEAIGMVSTTKPDEDHKVLEVVQKGYILSGKIIRPAKVKIGEYVK